MAWQGGAKAWLGEARLGLAGLGKAWTHTGLGLNTRREKANNHMNAIAELTRTITGTAPLIAHNGRLADPRSAFTKELSEAATRAKKDKTESAWDLLAKVEWMGSLYTTEPLQYSVSLRDYSITITGGGRPCIEGEQIEKMLQVAAPKNKKAAFKAGVFCDGQFPLLIGGKATTVLEAFDDESTFFSKTAKVGRMTILRTRPRWRHWSATVTINYIPSMVNPADVANALEAGGAVVGLGDWRPKYGRFSVSCK
jgi:hypothetical protein